MGGFMPSTSANSAGQILAPVEGTAPQCPFCVVVDQNQWATASNLKNRKQNLHNSLDRLNSFLDVPNESQIEPDRAIISLESSEFVGGWRTPSEICFQPQKESIRPTCGRSTTSHGYGKLDEDNRALHGLKFNAQDWPSPMPWPTPPCSGLVIALPEVEPGRETWREKEQRGGHQSPLPWPMSPFMKSRTVPSRKGTEEPACAKGATYPRHPNFAAVLAKFEKPGKEQLSNEQLRKENISPRALVRSSIVSRRLDVSSSCEYEDMKTTCAKSEGDTSCSCTQDIGRNGIISLASCDKDEFGEHRMEASSGREPFVVGRGCLTETEEGTQRTSLLRPFYVPDTREDDSSDWSHSSEEEDESSDSEDGEYDVLKIVTSEPTELQWLSVQVPPYIRNFRLRRTTGSLEVKFSSSSKYLTVRRAKSSPSPKTRTESVIKDSSSGLQNAVVVGAKELADETPRTMNSVEDDELYSITPIAGAFDDITADVSPRDEPPELPAVGEHRSNEDYRASNAFNTVSDIRRPLASRWDDFTELGRSSQLLRSQSEGSETSRVKLVALETPLWSRDRDGNRLSARLQKQPSLRHAMSLDRTASIAKRRPVRVEQGRIPSTYEMDASLGVEGEPKSSSSAEVRGVGSSAELGRMLERKLVKNFKPRRVMENVGEGLQNLAAMRRGKGERIPEAAKTSFGTSFSPEEALDEVAFVCGTHLGLKVFRRRGALKLKVLREKADNEGYLRADIEFVKLESGLTKVSFKRSRYDWGKTEFFTLYELFESVQQYLWDSREDAVVTLHYKR